MATEVGLVAEDVICSGKASEPQVNSVMVLLSGWI
jgi:hypothetical protein